MEIIWSNTEAVRTILGTGTLVSRWRASSGVFVHEASKQGRKCAQGLANEVHQPDVLLHNSIEATRFQAVADRNDGLPVLP